MCSSLFIFLFVSSDCLPACLPSNTSFSYGNLGNGYSLGAAFLGIPKRTQRTCSVVSLLLRNSRWYAEYTGPVHTYNPPTHPQPQNPSTADRRSGILTIVTLPSSLFLCRSSGFLLPSCCSHTRTHFCRLCHEQQRAPSASSFRRRTRMEPRATPRELVFLWPQQALLP